MNHIKQSALALSLLLSLAPTTWAQPQYPGILRGTFTTHTDRVLCVAVSGDGKTMASGSADKTARLWDMMTAKEGHLLEHANAVSCLAFSPDGSKLATGSGNLVIVWDVATGKKSMALQGTGPVSRIAFAASNKALAASGTGWKTCWDADSGKVKGTVRTGTPWFAFAPDGESLAISQPDGSVQVCDVATGKPSVTLKGHEGLVFALSFSPDGKVLATGASAGGINGLGRDKSIKLWDVATGKATANLVGHLKGVYSLTFTRDGKFLLAADYNGSMKLWDLTAASVKATLGQVKEGDQLRGTPIGFWAISPDLKTWVVGAGQRVSWLDISDLTASMK